MALEPATSATELAILLPVRNEGANLAVMLRTLRAVVEAPHEVLVVCDDPGDTSIPVAENARKSHPGVRLVLNSRGRGILNALRAGVEASTSKYVLVFAADEIGPVLALEDMLALAREGCDFVSVTRYAHGGRRLGGSRIGGALSWLANRLFWLSGGALTDSTTGIKLFRRDAFERLKLDSTVGWSVAFQMAIQAQLAGLALGEVPILSIDRLYGGQSTFRLGPWVKQYAKLFLSGLAHAPALRRTSSAAVRVRVPANVSPPGPGYALTLAGIVAAWFGPLLAWTLAARIPSARIGSYAGLAATLLLAVTLPLAADARWEAALWVALAVIEVRASPAAAIVTAVGGGGAFLLRAGRWRRVVPGKHA